MKHTFTISIIMIITTGLYFVLTKKNQSSELTTKPIDISTHPTSTHSTTLAPPLKIKPTITPQLNSEIDNEAKANHVVLSKSSLDLLERAKTSPNEQGELLQEIVEHIGGLSEKSSEEAYVFFLELPSGLLRSSCVGSLGYSIKLYPNGNVLDFLPRLHDPSEIADLLRGLTSKISYSGRAAELLDLYASKIDSKDILSIYNGAAAEHYFTLDFNNGVKRLLALDDSTAKVADSSAIRMLTAKSTDDGIKVLQALIDNGKFTRFDNAAPDFVKMYSIYHPSDSLKWTVSLPDELPTKSNLVFYAFSNYYKKNPQDALQSLEKINDKKLLERLQNVIAAREKKK